MKNKQLECARDLISIQLELNNKLSSYVTEEALRHDGLTVENLDSIEESITNLIHSRFRSLKARMILK